MTENLKQCTKCKCWLPATPDYFYRNKKTNDGLRCHCKDCVRQLYHDPDKVAAYGRIYRRENAERIAKAKKKDYQENREHYSAYKRQWQTQNCKRIRDRKRKQHHDSYWHDAEYRRRKLERDRAWRKAHPEEQQRYYELHKETIKKRVKEWVRAHPGRARKNRRGINARRRARKAHAKGSYNTKDIERMYEAQHGECYYCSKSVGDDYHIDHVIPLSRGGSNDPSNLVIACPACNQSKSNKLPHEWQGTNKLL